MAESRTTPPPRELSGRAEHGMPGSRRRVVSIVIPLLNERENLPPLYERLCALAERLDRGVEYLFVDDGSTDGSFEVLRELAAKDPRVRIVRLARNFGSHAAVLAGFTSCLGDHAVALAADLQDPPELVIELLKSAEAGHDIVLGYREQRDDPALRVLLSSIYHRLMSAIAISSWPKTGFDYVLLSRRVLDVVIARPEKNTSIVGQILFTGFATSLIPYRRARRHAGVSKWTVGKRLKLAIDSVVAFSYLPIRFMSAVGLALAAIGTLYALLVVAAHVWWAQQITGWASLMTVVLVVSGVQMIMLGVIGEYLWRVFDEVRGRAPYIVADRIGFEDRHPC